MKSLPRQRCVLCIRVRYVPSIGLLGVVQRHAKEFLTADRTRCCQGLTLETSLGLHFPLTELYRKKCASNLSCIMHICSKKHRLDFLQSLRLCFGSYGFRWRDKTVRANTEFWKGFLHTICPISFKC